MDESARRREERQQLLTQNRTRDVLWVFKEAELSPALQAYITTIMTQTFGAAARCGATCLYHIYMTTPVTKEALNTDPAKYFAGMYTVTPAAPLYEIYNVITNPALRGQKIAQTMIREGMNRLGAPARGFWLGVDTDNTFYEQAVRAYSRVGFTYPRVVSQSPSGTRLGKQMLGMSTELQEPSDQTVARALQFRRYINQCNQKRTIYIDTTSIRDLYAYNVRNKQNQGKHEMTGYFTEDPTTRVMRIASYEPFPYDQLSLPPGWSTTTFASETYYIDTTTSRTYTKPEFMFTPTALAARSQMYNAIWGYKIQSDSLTTTEVTWHTHPSDAYSTQEQTRFFDLPSIADFVYVMTQPITTPLRIHLLFSYNTIYSLQLSSSFSAALAFILHETPNATLVVADIATCIQTFLQTLVGNVRNMIYIPNTRSYVVDLWCNITAERLFNAYDQNTAPNVRAAVDSLKLLMGKDERLFHINSIEYDEITEAILTLEYNII